MLVAGYQTNRPKAWATIAGITYRMSDENQAVVDLYGPSIRCIVIDLYSATL